MTKTGTTTTGAARSPLLSGRDRITIAITVAAAVAAGVLHYAHSNAVVAFIVSAIALATLASLVGRSVEALGDRLGPNATGILQTALGNLPELFVILFALKAGLFGVVKATIVGSILANVLLVLGAAFVVGGLKHGRQRFAADAPAPLSGPAATKFERVRALPPQGSARTPAPALTHARACTCAHARHRRSSSASPRRWQTASRPCRTRRGARARRVRAGRRQRANAARVVTIPPPPPTHTLGVRGEGG